MAWQTVFQSKLRMLPAQPVDYDDQGSPHTARVVFPASAYDKGDLYAIPISILNGMAPAKKLDKEAVRAVTYQSIQREERLALEPAKRAKKKGQQQLTCIQHPVARRNTNAWFGYLPLFIAEDKGVSKNAVAREETNLYLSGGATDFGELGLTEAIKIGGMGRSGAYAYMALMLIPLEGQPILQVLWDGTIHSGLDGTNFLNARQILEAELQNTARVIRAFNKEALAAHGLHAARGKLKL